MNEGIMLNIVDFVYESGQIYFIAFNKPFIWQYDYIKGMITILTNFPEDVAASGAFVKLIKVKEKIYCIPCFADNIYCYNLRSGRFYSLNIPKEIFCKMPKRKIIEPINVNDNLYCVCRSPHLIIEVNTDNDTYSIYEFQGMKQEHNFFAVRLEKDAIIYPFLQNQLVSFGLISKEFYMKTLYENNIENCAEENYIYNFGYDSYGGIWWSNFKGEVYHITHNRISQIVMPDDFIGQYKDDINRDRPGINGMIFMHEKICFILASDYRILQFDMFGKNFIWSENPGKDCFRKQEIYFRYNIINEKRLLLYSRDTKFFYVWDRERGFIDKFCIGVPAKFLAQNRTLQLCCDFRNESCECNLRFYLEFLNFYESDKRQSIEKDGKMGRRIYINSNI